MNASLTISPPIMLRQSLCVLAAVLGYFLTISPKGIAWLFWTAVTEAISFLPGSSLVSLIIKLVFMPSLFDPKMIGVVLSASGIGWFIAKYYGARPNFPWQAERFRRICSWASKCFFLLGMYAAISVAILTYGLDNLILVITTLWIYDQWLVLSLILLLMVMGGFGLMIAFAAGLNLYSHFGVRWIAPGFLQRGIGRWAVKFVGLHFFPWKTLGLDSVVAGAVGQVLNDLDSTD